MSTRQAIVSWARAKQRQGEVKNGEAGIEQGCTTKGKSGKLDGERGKKRGKKVQDCCRDTAWILQYIPIQFLTGADSWPITFQGYIVKSTQ